MMDKTKTTTAMAMMIEVGRLDSAKKLRNLRKMDPTEKGLSPIGSSWRERIDS